MEYSFTLKYKLAEGDCNHSELVQRLGAGGCSDATVGIGKPLHIALMFTRESDDATSAVMSALTDIKRLIPTAKLIEVSTRFDSSGLTREPLQELIRSDPEIMGGIPVFVGSRLPIENILASIARGVSRERIFEDYPLLTQAHIDAAFAYAAAYPEYRPTLRLCEKHPELIPVATKVLRAKPK